MRFDLYQFFSDTERKLGLIPLILIGIGGAVGPGIFVLLSPGAELAGAALPWAFLLGGILSLGIALVYAEFASAMPFSGASLNLLFEAFGRSYLPFAASWLLVLGDISIVAISALAFGNYVSLLIPVNAVFLAVIVLIAMFLINIRGTGKAALFQGAIAFLLVAGLATLVGLSFSGVDISFSLFDYSGNPISVIGATAVIFTAFIGYGGIVSIAGEVKNPERNIGIALIATIVIITVLYFLISWVSINVVSPQALAESGAPLFLVAEQLGGAGKTVVFSAAILGALSTLITTLMVGSRKLYAISKEGFFKNTLGKLNRWEVPVRSLSLVGIISLLLVLSDSVGLVAYLANAAYLVIAILVIMAIFKMRTKRPFLRKPFEIPLFPWLPIAVGLLALTVFLFIDLAVLLIIALWAILGLVLYLVAQIKKERARLMIMGVLVLLNIVLFVFLLVLFLTGA